MLMVEAGIQAARVLDDEENQKAEACGMRGELLLVTKTPWNQGISFLFANMTLPSACGPKPSPEELIRSWDKPSADESALRDYLTRFHSGAFDRSHPLSNELVRLDGEGFGNRLADYLRQMFPAEMSAILDGLGTADELYRRSDKRRPLTPVHIAILKALKDAQPKTLTQYNLEQQSRVSRRTLGPCLKQLRDWGLVHRPYGDRKGDAITKKGAAKLNSQAGGR
jgi:hypothetical protein